MVLILRCCMFLNPDIQKQLRSDTPIKRRRFKNDDTLFWTAYHLCNSFLCRHGTEGNFLDFNITSKE